MATLGRLVITVSKDGRITKWMCFSEKVDQELVVNLTIDKRSAIYLKNDLFDLT